MWRWNDKPLAYPSAGTVQPMGGEAPGNPRNGP